MPISFSGGIAVRAVTIIFSIIVDWGLVTQVITSTEDWGLVTQAVTDTEDRNPLL